MLHTRVIRLVFVAVAAGLMCGCCFTPEEPPTDSSGPPTIKWYIDDAHVHSHPGTTGHHHFREHQCFWTRYRSSDHKVEFTSLPAGSCGGVITSPQQRVIAETRFHELAGNWFYYTIAPVSLTHPTGGPAPHYLYYLEWETGPAGRRAGNLDVCPETDEDRICALLRDVSKAIENGQSVNLDVLFQQHPGAAHTHSAD